MITDPQIQYTQFGLTEVFECVPFGINQSCLSNPNGKHVEQTVVPCGQGIWKICGRCGAAEYTLR